MNVGLVLLSCCVLTRGFAINILSQTLLGAAIMHVCTATARMPGKMSYQQAHRMFWQVAPPCSECAHQVRLSSGKQPHARNLLLKLRSSLDGSQLPQTFLHHTAQEDP